MQCLLADKMDERLMNLLAAFISGVAFRFVSHIPLTFMSFAVIIACQVLWQKFCSRDVANNNGLATVQRLPWARIVFPISLSFLVDRFFMHHEVVNSLAKGFINGTSNNVYVRRMILTYRLYILYLFLYFSAQRMHDLVAMPDETILSLFQQKAAKPFFF